MSGNLWKQDTSGSSWARRWVVVKDSFLAWYDEVKEDKKAAAAGAGGGGLQAFNIHPKGIVPLDGVDVEVTRAGPPKASNSGIRLSHPSLGTKTLLLCAKDDAERDKWVAVIQAAAAV